MRFILIFTSIFSVVTAMAMLPDSSWNRKRSLKSQISSVNKLVSDITSLNEAIAETNYYNSLEDEEDQKDYDIENDFLESYIDKLLLNLFIVLKDSGLINSVIKFALTDEEVRHGISQITIELVESGVIPYQEIFEALKESGLAVDVIKNILTDPETRNGTIQLILELLPEIIEMVPELIRSIIDNLIREKRIESSMFPKQISNSTVSKLN